MMSSLIRGLAVLSCLFAVFQVTVTSDEPEKPQNRIPPLSDPDAWKWKIRTGDEDIKDGDPYAYAGPNTGGKLSEKLRKERRNYPSLTELYLEGYRQQGRSALSLPKPDEYAGIKLDESEWKVLRPLLDRATKERQELFAEFDAIPETATDRRREILVTSIRKRLRRVEASLIAPVEEVIGKDQDKVLKALMTIPDYAGYVFYHPFVMEHIGIDEEDSEAIVKAMHRRHELVSSAMRELAHLPPKTRLSAARQQDMSTMYGHVVEVVNRSKDPSAFAMLSECVMSGISARKYFTLQPEPAQEYLVEAIPDWREFVED